MQSHFSGDLVTQTTGPGSNYTVLANFNLPVDVRDMHGEPSLIRDSSQPVARA